MESSRHDRDETLITDDSELYSLIEDDLVDCQVEVETRGDTVVGYISVHQEEPFVIRVGRETIFAEDILKIRSRETDAVWRLRGIAGRVDTDYKPVEIKRLQRDSIDEATLPALPEPSELLHESSSRNRKDKPKREAKKRRTKKEEELEVPKDLDSFATEHAAKRVELIVRQNGIEAPLQAYVVGPHQDSEGWKLVVYSAEEGNPELHILAAEIDFTKSRRVG